MKAYNDFINTQVKVRNSLIAERYEVFNWKLDERLPHYFNEKMDEIKIMFVMGLDNFSIKIIAIFIEELLQHIVIANEAKFLDDYKRLLHDYSKKSGHNFLKILKEKNLIHEDDYVFCSKYCNDYEHGGQRIRNIELHNLMAEKIDKFTFRDEVINNMNTSDVQALEKIIKENPTFAHIGARDMNTRNLLNEIKSLNNLINRNASTLYRLNILQDEQTFKIINKLPNGKKFVLIVDENVSKEFNVKSDIKKLRDVINIEEDLMIDEKLHKKVCKYFFTTSGSHTSEEVIRAFIGCRNDNYNFISIGIDK